MINTLLTLALLFFPQDSKEALGPKDGIARGPHPLEAEVRLHPASLRPELRGVHPRVFVTTAEIERLRGKSRGSRRAIWQRALANLRAMTEEPALPPAQTRRAQNNVAINLAGAALAYKIEGDRRYLDAARKNLEAALAYDVWGYTYSKPNVDLAAGHLLYGVGWAYDLLYDDLTPAERQRVRAKLVRQARLLFDHYTLKPGRQFSYSQNHLSIPLAGLGVAAWALWDEEPEAARWAALVRAIYGRVLETYSRDGYYYEGFEYWVFSTPWLIHYLDALRHSTGEDLFDQPGFRATHLFALHSLLPNGQDIFDYGDAFEGSSTRLRQSPDSSRTHPGGKLASNYNLLYRLAARFASDEIQTVAHHLEELGQTNQEDFWSLLWFDETRKARPLQTLPTWHVFDDHGVAYWRSSWQQDATAFSFKCGPPEGHHAVSLLKSMPDWRQETGHAHPDAASLILWAKGRYLLGDSGYAGVPTTDQHNTILIDGKGQAAEGSGHNAFDKYPPSRLGQIRLTVRDLDANRFDFGCDATDAYSESLHLKSLHRDVSLVDSSTIEVTDSIQSSVPVRPSFLWHGDEAGILGTLVRITTQPELTSRLEPNWLTAAGSPGSVDKGPREARGVRLVLTPASPSASSKFSTRIRFDSVPQRRKD